jgi:ribose 5-phosphate isomerase B
MKIALGSDHRGLELKAKVKKLVEDAGHTTKDFGAFTTETYDYPDAAQLVGKAVASHQFDRGILICGTGIGMCIAANKVDGVRAALTYNNFTACRARQHNDANIICLSGEDPPKELDAIINSFLTCQFEGGRHQRRVDKIMSLEK